MKKITSAEAILLTKKKKEEVIAKLVKNGGFVIPAVREVKGITIQDFYIWLREDKDFKRAYEDSREIGIDIAEGKLQEMMLEGNFPAVKFFLQTRGKDRGYGSAKGVDDDNKRIEEESRLRKKLQKLPDKELHDLVKLFRSPDRKV